MNEAGRGWYDIGDGWAGMWDGTKWTGERISHEQLAALTRPVAPPPPRTSSRPAQRRPLSRRQRWVSATAVAVVAVSFVALLALRQQGVIEPTKDPFTEAVERYNRDQPSVVEQCCSVLTVTLGRPNEPITPQRRHAFSELLRDLGFSDGVVARMEGTRALDGTQEAEGTHATVSWTYHPDNGLRMVFEPR